MARELIGFRDTLEQLNRTFPGRELLTLQEVQQLTGYKSKTSVMAHFPAVCGGKYNKATVARILCGGEA